MSAQYLSAKLIDLAKRYRPEIPARFETQAHSTDTGKQVE
jgi:hypothetical protein